MSRYKIWEGVFLLLFVALMFLSGFNQYCNWGFGAQWFVLVAFWCGSLSKWAQQRDIQEILGSLNKPGDPR